METWRKFLLQEEGSTSVLAKIVELENKARILVQKKIKELESKHKLTITDKHLKLAGYRMYGSPYRFRNPNYAEAKIGLEAYYAALEKPGKISVSTEKKIDQLYAEYKKANKQTTYGSEFHEKKLEIFRKANKESAEAELVTNLIRGLETAIEDISLFISKDFINTVNDMLDIKKKSKWGTLEFTPMIVAMFTIEKGHKPESIFGAKFSIDTKSDPFEMLEIKTINVTNDAVKELKGSFLWPIVSVFMPDGWEEASRNIIRICCHLLRTKFSSTKVSFMGTNIATPSYTFISDFISGRMAGQIRQTLGAALGSPMKSFNYLKFKGGDQILQEAVTWINANQKPSLEQCIGQVDKVLNHMKTAGFEDYEMYISFTASKQLLLKVLG